VYGPRTIGVVLTGGMDDGAAGLLAVVRRGGVCVVQDPDDALGAEMPRAAIAAVKSPDHRVPVSEIPALLSSLAREPAAEPVDPTPVELAIENGYAEMKDVDMRDVDKLGTPSGFTCPECQGALWELHDGELLRFRCHVGHAYSDMHLEDAQSQVMEAALWAALRSLEENITLVRRMAARARAHNNLVSAANFQEKAASLDRHAAVIRHLLAQESRTSAAS
jgi:two-component system, chemotaxis family, protein-glutamate methylesterase/glutaminase